jgi:hypothetical protein
MVFRNFAVIVLYYYAIKNKIDIPIIVPIMFAVGNVADLFYRHKKNSFLNFMSYLTGTPNNIEHRTVLACSILMTFYVFFYHNNLDNTLYNFFCNFFLLIIAIYILLVLNQLYAYFRKK